MESDYLRKKNDQIKKQRDNDFVSLREKDENIKALIEKVNELKNEQIELFKKIDHLEDKN